MRTRPDRKHAGDFERHRPRGVTAVAVVVVLSVGCWLVVGFSTRAAVAHRTALTISHLTAVVADMHGTETEVNAHDLSVDEGIAELRRVQARAQELFDELPVGTARRVRPLIALVQRGLRAEWTMLKQGKVARADAIDRRTVDPSFEDLKLLLDRVSTDAVKDADQAAQALRDASIAVLLGGGVLVSLLSWRSRRRALRLAQLAERTRVVAASERRFRALVDNGDDVIVVIDEHARVLEMSDSVRQVLGVSPEPRIGRRISEFVRPDEAPLVAAELARVLERGKAGPTQLHCRDAEAHWRNIEVVWTNMLQLPEISGIVLNVRDVTVRHRLEEELRHRAFHDSLTGLANRALLHDRIEHAMASREHCRAALMVIDLDGFKHLNDSLGHPAGDHALTVVAERLVGVCRPKDTVARLGGDEFAVLIEDPETRDEVHALGQRLLNALAFPFKYEVHTLSVGASLGIAFVEPGVNTADDLIRNADVGLYAAKDAGRGLVQAFEPRMYDESRARFELESDLRVALLEEQLELHYQPIIDLTTAEPIGFEALVRWNHPTRGRISPDVFIPIAEASNLIVPIGRWILSRACIDLTTWSLNHTAAAEMYVSVNMSARQLADPDIVEDVRQSMKSAALDPSRLVLEITETTLVQDVHIALARLNALKELGVHLSVDDFGTGYSSLAYLRQFPIDTVKIDKSFIDNLTRGRDDESFVSAILRLSEALNLSTLAEGVETKEQALALQRLGCQMAQGYYYARPLDERGVIAMLSAYSASTNAKGRLIRP